MSIDFKLFSTMKLLNHSLTFGIIFATAIASVLSETAGKPRTVSRDSNHGNRSRTSSSSCSVESFEACLSVIKSVTDSEQLAFASTQKELDKACRKLQHGLNCADDHMKRCATRSQRQVFEDVVKGTRDVISKLCIPGPDQRCCYKNVSESEDKCVTWIRKIQELDKDIQENIKSEKIDEGLHSFCCTFIQAYECQVNHLKKDCGPEAVEFFEKYLNEMSHSLIHRHCSSFSHRECVASSQVVSEVMEGNTAIASQEHHISNSSILILILTLLFEKLVN